MKEAISPKYLMKLVEQLNEAIYKEYESYKNVRHYIEKWHEYDERNDWANFRLIEKSPGNIDLLSTLHAMDGELVLKIAIEMGVPIPGFLPAIPTFQVDLKELDKSAFDVFSNAIKQSTEHPDIAVGLANSALESLLKSILKDDRIPINYDQDKTLYDLTKDLLKAFEMFPSPQLPDEIMHIGSGLLKVSQKIEELRSNHTNFHGKMATDYLITDPMYAVFIINAVTTVGLFIDNLYKAHYPKQNGLPSFQNEDEDDFPF